MDDDVAGGGVDDVVDRDTSEDSLGERCDNLVVVLDLTAHEATEGSAVLFADNHVMGHVDKTTGEVSGVGGLQGGVGKTLARTVG